MTQFVHACHGEESPYVTNLLWRGDGGTTNNTTQGDTGDRDTYMTKDPLYFLISKPQRPLYSTG